MTKRVLVILLYFYVFTYMAWFPYFRALGTAPLLLVLLAAGMIMVLCSLAYAQRMLFAYVALAAIYVVLSYLGDLHSGVTLLFEPSAIPQQAAHALMFCTLVPIFAYFYEQVQMRTPEFVWFERSLLVVLVLLVFVGRIGRGFDQSDLPQLGTLVNPLLLMIFIMFRMITFAPNIPRLAKASIVGLATLLTASLQTLLAIIGFIVLSLMPKRRAAILCGAIVVAVVVGLGAALIPETLYGIDANSGVRAWIWSDVFERVAATYGTGVGFGTETLRPYFLYEGNQVIVRSTSLDGYIHVGAHNAFLDAYYRMGILGLLLMGLYFGRKVSFFLQNRKSHTVFDTWVLYTLFLTMWVNVAVVSFNFLFGTSVLLGWLVFREAQIRKSLK